MITAANGGTTSKNTSPFFGQAFESNDWSTGWTIAKIYDVAGQKFMFLLKKNNDGGNEINVHIQSISDSGYNTMVNSHNWTEGWTTAEFYKMNGKTYLFILKQSGYAKDGNNAKVHTVNFNGTIGDEIFGKKWTQGWTNCRIFKVNGKTFLFLLKKSGVASDGNNVHINSINDDGTIDNTYIFQYKWTEGWTTTEFYSIGGKIYLFLLKKSGTGSDGTNVHIHEMNLDGSVGSRVHSYAWSEGWTHARFFEACNRNYLLLYKYDSGSVDQGIVHLHHIVEGGEVGSRVAWFTEPRDEDNNTGSLAESPMNGPRRWLDTYSLLEPFATSGDNRFLFRYNAENGENDTLAIFPMHDIGPMVSFVIQSTAFIWIGMVGGKPWQRNKKYSLKFRKVTPSAGTWSNVDIKYKYRKAKGSTPDQDYYTAGIFSLNVNDGTKYEYELFYADDQVASGTFKTPEKVGNKTKFRAVFASCMDLDYSYQQTAWEHVKNLSPDLLMLCGDNAYPNTTARSMIWAEHLQQRGVPAFARLIKDVGVMATWDDHDFGPNNSHGGEMSAETKAESKEAFLELFPRSLNDALPSGGINYTFSWGNVHFFVLDLRYFREGEDGDLAGNSQLDWLEKSIGSANAAINVIISSTTLTAGGEDWDTDHGGEWDTLKKIIQKHPSTIIVTGDVHYCRIFSHDIGSGVTVREIISSGIAQTAGNADYPAGFVSLDFDTTIKTPVVTATIYYQDGTVHSTQNITF